ncbi:hypothetical protein QBC34DRAFT_403236 [Podospora aff. communis PSN243]|uniref:Wax synthase domain-containing protein n=1 Tax=Podospora aff. communis PSN243 TaxID=3040156 RepID=A0AAV9GRZ5_9PEZI|nr:hypothetical protein QBC34DRAFT_403236 [Podospora aff. communis PSN243]
MVLAAVGPEFIAVCAIAQMIDAREIKKCWDSAWADEERNIAPVEDAKSNGEVRKGGEEKWLGDSGAFFAAMGGFVLSGEDGTMSKYEHPEPVGSHRRKGIPRDKCVLAVSASGFKKLLELGIIQQLVRCNKLGEEHFHNRTIEDRSKGSLVAKAIVSVQLLWMVIQCIGRKVAGLPVTLLEAHVLIQIGFTIIAYVCWWRKPLDVAEPIVIPLGEKERAKLLQDCPEFFHDVENSDRRKTRKSLYVKQRTVLDRVLSPLAMSTYDLFWIFDDKTRGWAVILAVINGLLHCTTWFSYFPSPLEMWLWRASAVGIIAFNIGLWLVLLGPWGEVGEVYLLLLAGRIARIPNCSAFRALREALALVRAGSRSQNDTGEEDPTRNKPPVGYSGWPRGFLWAFFMGLFLFFNLFITVESFISIRSLPMGAYQTPPWSNFFPHI